MKLKKNKSQFKLINRLTIIFFLCFSINAIAKEKNYIAALVNNDPITFIDVKEKAKFLHFSKNKIYTHIQYIS